MRLRTGLRCDTMSVRPRFESMHRLTAADPANEALLRRLYEAATIDLRASDENYVPPAGQRHTWTLDLRRPLLRHAFLNDAARAMAAVLAAHCIDQVAGTGMGAAPLVCGLVGLGQGIDGMLVRDHPKRRGLIRPVEGDLDPQKELWLVDDVVNTGGSTLRLAATVRDAGLRPTGVLCLFAYGWGRGATRLQERGLTFAPLATLGKRKAWRRDSSRRLARRIFPDLP